MFDPNENKNPESYNSYYENPSESNPGSASYVSYYSDPEDSRKTGGKGGKTFLKIVAGLAAIAIVSLSSIELYKLFGNQKAEDGWRAENSSTNDTAEEKTGENQQPDLSTGNSPANNSASWIHMAAPEDALSIPDIVDKALPSVVGISAVFEYTQSYSWGFYQYDGGTQQIPGTGTGIVMNKDGYIITNAHCVYDTSERNCGKAVSVSVVMGDEDSTEYEAQIVGYDLETDLAVLKIEADNLVPAEFGNSDTLRVGELVVAIGNPLGFELFGTTTCGIVSALNREVTISEKEMTLIQTDTAINSGNSGGPLLNSYGQVIGINSAKISSNYASGAASVEGLAFAIPISDASEIIDDLINYGYVVGRPQIGITSTNVDAEMAQRFNMPEGVYVYSVTPGSAAEAAGIRQGDIITGIQGQTVKTTDELNKIKDEYDAGDTITLTVVRSGETLEMSLTLQEVQPQE